MMKMISARGAARALASSVADNDAREASTRGDEQRRRDAASPAMETSRILESICRLAVRLEVEEWVVGGAAQQRDSGGAAVALTLSAMARAHYRNDACLHHLCRAFCAAVRNGGDGGNLPASTLAQGVHALATLNYRDEEVLGELGVAVAGVQGNFCLQSLGNLAWASAVLERCGGGGASAGGEQNPLVTAITGEVDRLFPLLIEGRQTRVLSAVLGGDGTSVPRASAPPPPLAVARPKLAGPKRAGPAALEDSVELAGKGTFQDMQELRQVFPCVGVRRYMCACAQTCDTHTGPSVSTRMQVARRGRREMRGGRRDQGSLGQTATDGPCSVRGAFKESRHAFAPPQLH